MKRLLLALSAAYVALLLANIKLAARIDDSAIPVDQEHPSFREIRKSPYTGGRQRNINNATPDNDATNKNVRSNDNRNGHPLPSDQDISQTNSPKTSYQSNPSRLIQKSSNADEEYKVAGLDCAAHGGPANASEMVYWKEILQDNDYISPYFTSGEENEKYMTFEPDEGGFNNIRMALETVVTMAIAMGRTLVIPPSQGMYLLDGGNNTSQRNHFSFTDFYPLEAVAREHKGLKLISMEDFLQKQDLLVNHTSGQPIVPPRTDWNGASKASIWELHQWLRWVGKTPLWVKCIVGFAPSPRQQSRLMQKARILQNRKKARDVSHLVSNTSHRLAKALAHRKNVCLYDNTWRSTKVMHFTGDIASGTRLLIHFYAYLFFVDPLEEMFMKRFVRDHLRYVDEIQCAAARIVEAMKEKARLHNRNYNDAEVFFDTFHVRRGDFKVNKTLMNAEEVYANIADIMTPQSTLYIATDEKNRSYFEPFFQQHHVYFLDDFEHLVAGLNTNYYGLVEQLVVARGRRFVGCLFSTFSGFVTRLRGYHSTYNKLPGYRNGTLPTTYYYAPLRAKEIMHTYQQLSKPIHSREFPIGWTGIDLEDRVEDDVDDKD